MTHPPPPVAAGAVGSPAAAAARLRADVQGFLDEAEAVAGREIVPRRAAALLVPYDPHPLAGPTAGVGFAAVDVPSRCVVVTVGARPNGGGAVEVGRPHATALGEVPYDAALAASLAGARGSALKAAADGATPDEALDVLLPFIQVRNPAARVVTLRLSSDDWEVVRAAAAALRSVAPAADDLLIIGASNLSRDAAGDARKDRDALLLEQVIALNGGGVLDLVRHGGLVMTGAPVVAFVCEYARLSGAQGGQLVAYSHSGIVTGREDRVTGYAAVLLGAR